MTGLTVRKEGTRPISRFRRAAYWGEWVVTGWRVMAPHKILWRVFVALVRAFTRGDSGWQELLRQYPALGPEWAVFDISEIRTEILLGVPSPVCLARQPTVAFQPRRLTVNAPCPGFFLYDVIRIANEALTVGGPGDAHLFHPLFENGTLDLPPIHPALQFSMTGHYTGLVPHGMRRGDRFHLVASLQGPKDGDR